MTNIFFKRATVALALQLLALFTYIYIGFFLYDFPRKLEYYFIVIAFSVFLDQLLHYAEHRKFKLLFSPVIAGSAIFMLVTSFSIFTYLIATLVAILSKYIIRVQGRHVFNPGNLGVLFVVIFFSEDVSLVPGQWGVDGKFILVAVILGLLACSFANRLVVALSYITSFILLAVTRSYLNNDPILFNVGPLLGMSGIIFQFHMITDPQTTPSEYKYQVIFGFCVAMLDVYLRSELILFSQFISLSVVCALFILYYNKREIKVIQAGL